MSDPKSADLSGSSTSQEIAQQPVDADSDRTLAGDELGDLLTRAVDMGTQAVDSDDVVAVETPVHFGRYRIERKLGEGAMGTVYLAIDTQLERQVALKVPTIANREDDIVAQRFQREARAAAKLKHPNICPIHDVGEFEGTRFISMSYIDGKTLSHFISRSQPMPERRVARIVRKIASALAEAHRNGIIHRDLKPGNIIIDHHNEPIVMDFGLARNFDDGAEATLTQEGKVVGTPAYMSPEQLQGERRLGPAVDIYSLGILMYELLTGRRPYSGTTAVMIGQILYSAPHRIEKYRPDVSPKLADICKKAMAKKVSDRFSSMDQFAQAILDYLKNGSSKGTQITALDVVPSEETLIEELDAEDYQDIDQLPTLDDGVSQREAPRTGNAPERSIPKDTDPMRAAAAGVIGTLIVVGIVFLVFFNKGPSEDVEGAETDGEPVGTDSRVRDEQGRESSRGEFPLPPGRGFPRPRPMGATFAEISEAPDEFFEKADRNGDRFLDHRELFRHIVERADMDHDLQVSIEELKTAIEEWGEQLVRRPEGAPLRFPPPPRIN